MYLLMLNLQMDGLMSATDKTKLDGIEAGANKYEHPANHAATMITEDATHRFVTDTEKSTWNAKADKTVATTSVNGLMSKEDKTKLDGIAANANNYVHPDSHPATMITEDTDHKFMITEDTDHKFVTDAQIAAWNAKASTDVATGEANGLMSKEDKTKLDGIAANANNYVHPDDTNTKHVSEAQIAAWNAKASTDVATGEANGLMSKEDKTKLDGIAANANNYTHPQNHPATY